MLEDQSFAGCTYIPRETICSLNFSAAAATLHMEGTLLLANAYIVNWQMLPMPIVIGKPLILLSCTG